MAIDPPYRFDPFQNLVNVHWEATTALVWSTQYFVYNPIFVQDYFSDQPHWLPTSEETVATSIAAGTSEWFRTVDGHPDSENKGTRVNLSDLIADAAAGTGNFSYWKEGAYDAFANWSEWDQLTLTFEDWHVHVGDFGGHPPAYAHGPYLYVFARGFYLEADTGGFHEFTPSDWIGQPWQP